ncbi:MAG: hypothetical protein M1837_001754 [Sclerophora amabilis]|nr:MAG: hypothetical protein M1837_001754 [Sclerophora amabilis]
MTSTVDPCTGTPLPIDSIQRVLFVCLNVHVYQIPPLTSNKGYNATAWTKPPNPTARQIFTARLRVLETAVPSTSSNPSSNGDENGETVKTDILLEDPDTGQLFAAAPYTAPGVVEQALDSTRFFAITVRDEGGRKAVLGIGFEERSEAFDFGVCLQEVRKMQEPDKWLFGVGKKAGAASNKTLLPGAETKDFTLKEGQTIAVNIGSRKGRKRGDEQRDPKRGGSATGSPASSESSLFSIPPPPAYSPSSSTSSDSTMSFLPPPPSAQDVKAERRRSQQKIEPEPGSAADLGFDDGEFGEFHS